ncbi:MAG TPA: hypothetical protein VGF36_10205, partial [Rhodopila sp.]
LRGRLGPIAQRQQISGRNSRVLGGIHDENLCQGDGTRPPQPRSGQDQASVRDARTLPEPVFPRKTIDDPTVSAPTITG